MIADVEEKRGFMVFYVSPFAALVTAAGQALQTPVSMDEERAAVSAVTGTRLLAHRRGLKSHSWLSVWSSLGLSPARRARAGWRSRRL